MRTSTLAKEVGLGLHLQTHSREKGALGRFLLMGDRPGRHSIMQAQRANVIGLGGMGRGEIIIRRSSRTHAHTHTHTNHLGAYVSSLAGQISPLALFLQVAQPAPPCPLPHHIYLIINCLAKPAFSTRKVLLLAL